MCTFNRNNRECIHLLKQNKKFIDLTEEEFYYMCNDELNIAGIEEDDLVKFKLHDAELKSTQRIYGFVKYLHNENHTTFMICEHYDETGMKFYLDYVYSSFHHAFHRLNHHGSFSDWNQLTHIKKAHAPQWFVTEWLDKHVVTDDIDGEFENTEAVAGVNDVEETEAEIYPKDLLNFSNKDLAEFSKDQIDDINSVVKSIKQLKPGISDAEANGHIKNICKGIKSLALQLSADINSTFEQVSEQLSEISNRLNIISKSTITDKSLENVNKPVYTKPGCINHVIC